MYSGGRNQDMHPIHPRHPLYATWFLVSHYAFWVSSIHVVGIPYVVWLHRRISICDPRSMYLRPIFWSRCQPVFANHFTHWFSRVFLGCFQPFRRKPDAMHRCSGPWWCTGIGQLRPRKSWQNASAENNHKIYFESEFMDVAAERTDFCNHPSDAIHIAFPKVLTCGISKCVNNYEFRKVNIFRRP